MLKSNYINMFLALALVFLFVGCATTEYRGSVSYAPGKYKFRMADASVRPFKDGSDITEGKLTRARLEFTESDNEDNGGGAGLQIEGAESDKDLYRGTGVLSKDSKVTDIFGYFMYELRDGENARVPFRLGLFSHVYDLEDPVRKITWETFPGLRLSVEPEIVFARFDNLALSLFGEGSYGHSILDTKVKYKSMGTKENDAEVGTQTYGLEGGIRMAIDEFVAGISYIHRVGQSGDDNSLSLVNRVPESRYKFNGVAFTAGFRF